MLEREVGIRKRASLTSAQPEYVGVIGWALEGELNDEQTECEHYQNIFSIDESAAERKSDCLRGMAPEVLELAIQPEEVAHPPPKRWADIMKGGKDINDLPETIRHEANEAADNFARLKSITRTAQTEEGCSPYNFR